VTVFLRHKKLDLPTAEELGAEFERFLAQQGDDGTPS